MEPIQALTAGVLCSLLLQYPRPTLSAYIPDLIAILSCLLLHLREPTTLSLSLAIAYAAWTFLPGSFASLNLPSYTTFKRNTTFIQPKNDSDECKVCWDTAHALAQLPCGHHVCEGCLDLMNEHFQTACPMCRRPLFSSYDRAVFVLTKGSAACGAVNTILHLLVCVHEVRSAKYYSAMFSLGFSCMIGRHLWMYWTLIQHFGENWWRGSPATKGESAVSLRAAGLALVTGIVLLCSTLCTSRAIFR
jgi:ABC-type nickel/cobalt efflux system permease component RcnA